MSLMRHATHDVVWIAPGRSVDEAISLMEDFEIHHLPVVDHGTVVGMLSDRDLLLMVGWRLTCERHSTPASARVIGPTTVEEIMTRPVVKVSADDSLEHAARMLIERRIGALPVIRNGVLVAILSESDVLKAVLHQPDAPRWRHLLSRPVQTIMTRRVISVKPKTSLTEVLDAFRTHRIRHLPVAVGNSLIGIISDRDARRALGESLIRDAQAQQRGSLYLGPQFAMTIMTRKVRVIAPSSTIGSAMQHLLDHGIHALPVVDAERLSGIVAETDLIRAVADGAAHEPSKGLHKPIAIRLHEPLNCQEGDLT